MCRPSLLPAEQAAPLQPNNAMQGIGYPGQSVPYIQPVFSAQPPFSRQTNGQCAIQRLFRRRVPPVRLPGKKKGRR